MLTYLNLLAKKSLPSTQVADFQCHYSHCQANLKQQQEFRKAMQIAPGQELPISYEFLTAFPYILKVFADKRFAYKAIGLVHLSSEFQQFNNFDRALPFDLEINIYQGIEHPKGKEVKIVIEFHQQGQHCLSNTNVMLKRDKTDKPTAKKTQQMRQFQQEYFLLISHKLARRYAKVSGDYNPIHLYDVSAKLFGFDRAIIHGMYMCHRLLLDKQIEVTHCKANFKMPCKLPAKVGVCQQEQHLIAFSDSDRLHMDIELFES
ncbi:MaoC/PaaZ C-terminal domain-containing protein [Thalassotalea sp. PS06]|uniref:MaoC/PaaZ C-terminal domain-containing protein n=1 Tax=Thalassotalea sp. PS06 TaxID=2594005 RepID=UPI00116531A8|nr:MaoC/PaaZ C-terminal domain-containing protein [Thalassotalea sp. PS06]QDP00717.1 hypothetical protein FNC98_04725 [Thalassotalea sp. PS06]